MEKIKANTDKWDSFLTILESQFDEVQAYQILLKKQMYDSFKIIVGRTQNNNWIGISPLVYFRNYDCSKKSFGERQQRQKEELDIEDLELKAHLEEILSDLSFPIASYYSVISEGTIVRIAVTKAILIEELIEAARFLDIWKFSEFDDNWGEEEEKKEYEQLNQSVFCYLTDLRLYVMGTWNLFDVYIIGKTPEEDWLGISTTADWRI